MKAKFNDFDFTPYMQKVISKGVNAADAQVYLSDLLTILHAAERTKGRLALTKGADLILHELLEDAEGHRLLGSLVFGAGRTLVHNANSFMTPDFDQAWANTREVFAAQGVALLADYRSDKSASFRSAGACFLEGGSLDEDSPLGTQQAA